MRTTVFCPLQYLCIYKQPKFPCTFALAPSIALKFKYLLLSKLSWTLQRRLQLHFSTKWKPSEQAQKCYVESKPASSNQLQSSTGSFGLGKTNHTHYLISRWQESGEKKKKINMLHKKCSTATSLTFLSGSHALTKCLAEFACSSNLSKNYFPVPQKGFQKILLPTTSGGRDRQMLHHRNKNQAKQTHQPEIQMLLTI